MKIGIDFDGVIIEFEKLCKVYAELYDLLVLNKEKNCTDKDSKDYKILNRFNWTKEERKVFTETYFHKISKNAAFLPGCLEVLKLLKKDGHKFFLITARGFVFKNEIFYCEKRLKKLNIKFDKKFFNIEDKVSVCVENNIDIMIDDRFLHCKNLSEAKIKTLFFRDIGTEELSENDFLTEVNNWGEVYRQISNFSKKENF